MPGCSHRGNWDFMVHGIVFVNDIQQSGPRGGDKFFGESWFMGMAQHDPGPGKFTARAMLSLDPALISERRYPELFQLGETAFGNPIVDGQHPHDFFMELGAFYDWKLDEHNLISFYAAPVGDPALGPPAYPHRASASEDPIAVLGHHMQDSTHIADEVVTAGYTYRFARVEVSGFHGREPDENRWNIDAGAIDSWAARLTISPTQNWSGQFSLGTLKSPEALSPQEDLRRMTASIEYARPIPKGNWASSVVWGRNRSLVTGEVLNSYLFESTLHFLIAQRRWTRIENVDRTNLVAARRKSRAAKFRRAFSGAHSSLHRRLRSRIPRHPAFLHSHRRPSHLLWQARFAQRHLRRSSHRRSNVRAHPPRRRHALIPRQNYSGCANPFARASSKIPCVCCTAFLESSPCFLPISPCRRPSSPCFRPNSPCCRPIFDCALPASD